MIKRAVLYCTHYGELNYVNTNWYEVVLERTCQDICSARTTQLDIWVLYCIVWRFAWIRNRQYRQFRRLRCEILIRSVFTLPEPLPSASYCILFCSSAVTTAYSTAAVPSVSNVRQTEAFARATKISENTHTSPHGVSQMRH